MKVDLETCYFEGFPEVNQLSKLDKGIWFENDEWLVRKHSDINAWTHVFPKEQMIDAFLYYYGLDDYFEERLQTSKTFEIKYYRKLI